MTKTFKTGDHVTWNSEEGRIAGVVAKVHTKDAEFLGRRRPASAEAPQYEVKSGKTGAHAMHRAEALTRAKT